jgi:FKBP-type peptidyl-prolyl cis-trans isomerase FkpA
LQPEFKNLENMKKLLLALVLGVAFTQTGCLKNDSSACNFSLRNVVAPGSEIMAIQTYITNAGLTGYQQHPMGFFYKIDNPGNGKVPELCSSVNCNYSGRLTNGNIFDQTTSAPANFTIGQTIEGWKLGIPLIKKGGRIGLIIPPSLGYGSQEIRNNNAVVIIPANSILVFDVTVVDVF